MNDDHTSAVAAFVEAVVAVVASASWVQAPVLVMEQYAPHCYVLQIQEAVLDCTPLTAVAGVEDSDKHLLVATAGNSSLDHFRDTVVVAVAVEHFVADIVADIVAAVEVVD